MNTTDTNPPFREELEMGPAIGLLELCSVARGIEVADAVLWEADIEMLASTAVQPGKYVMLFTGSVEDVSNGVRHGAELAANDLVDQLMIPNVHEQVEQGLRRQGGTVDGTLDALGVVETHTVAASILAADQALKAATVDMLELRIANGLGGKSYFTITGEVSDVRSAVTAGASLARERGQLAREVVIPRPHKDLVRHL
jgi:microcompartment protein CcmL/EutN